MTPDREKQWIKEIAEGDRFAFIELYQAYEKPIFRYAFKFLHNIEDAEELTQDVLLTIWKTADTFNGFSKLSTWIYSITRYKSLNAKRRKRHQGVVLKEGMYKINPEKKMFRDMAFSRALKYLSSEHQEVIDLVFHGFSYEEIAEIIECPVGTVKSRMYYARKRLKEVLESMGIDKEVL